MLRRTITHRLGKACLVLLVAGAVSVAGLYCVTSDWTEIAAGARRSSGTSVVDRNGRVLRLFPDLEGNFSLWYPIGRIPTRVTQAVIAAEDKRFRSHPGCDPIAICRALMQNLIRGRTHSGASTITQQVVRLINPRPRTFRSKIVEALESLKMEWQLSKDHILELYMNLSPMGGNIKGWGLASRVYLEKDVAHLSLPEAAALAAVPRSPARLSPRTARGRAALQEEKKRVLSRMLRLGHISGEDFSLTAGAEVRFHRTSLPLEAPHLVDMVAKTAPNEHNQVRTTIDLDMQHMLEQVLQSHRSRLARLGIRQACALVVSADRAQILAMVGSLGYGPKDSGYVNGVLMTRGVGSTLKPFLYALALDKGLTAASEIPDTFRTYPTPRGDYLPFNADRRTYGPVTVRVALGNSLNLPAVKTLRFVGVPEFREFLVRAGMLAEESPSADHYGLGLAIGNMEAGLLKVVQAYTAPARRGVFRSVVWLADQQAQETPMFSPEAAYIIGDILSDPTSRLLTFGNPDWLDFPYPVSVKTGTSTNHRDSWAMGYTAQHIVGLWAGNFDGSPGYGASASKVCGPILKAILGRIYGMGTPGRVPRPPAIREVSVCWMSGKPASPGCDHAYMELFAGRPSDTDRCVMNHSNDPHLYLGPQYASWLHNRRTVQGTGRFRLVQPGDAEAESPVSDQPRHAWEPRSGIRIVSPHDRDRLVLSSPHGDRIRFRAIPGSVVSHVIWLVDGVELARTAAPYEFFWKPNRGRHRVLAVTPDQSADAITITVE
ncbi:MAG: penicillin-binding protein 1C [Thermodesulfobacteriota bacterium]